MARQIGTAREHVRGRRPAWPLLFCTDTVDAAPAEPVAPDANAVAQRQPISQNEVKSPLGGIHHDGAGRIVGGEVHGSSWNRARAPAAKEVRAAAHEIAA